MVARIERKTVLLGCALDCDDQLESILEKNSSLLPETLSDDPYDWVSGLLRKSCPDGKFDFFGSLEVPGWLRPQQQKKDMQDVTAEAFINFMESQGCAEYARQIQKKVADHVLPDISCFIGVDHSLSGGALRAAADYYGHNNLSLIVLDSHVDAIPLSATLGAIQYDIETNPNSVYDAYDPLLLDRKDTYNASSFLDYIIHENVVLPDNIYLIGISDYPPPKAFKIKDKRIVNYVKSYSCLKYKGVKLLTNKDCNLNIKRIETVLQKIKTPYIYISIDMDIGAIAAVEGVRYKNRTGLKESNILKIVSIVQEITNGNFNLAGLDVTEFNARKAGSDFHKGERTYPLAAEIVKNLVC